MFLSVDDFIRQDQSQTMEVYVVEDACYWMVDGVFWRRCEYVFRLLILRQAELGREILIVYCFSTELFCVQADKPGNVKSKKFPGPWLN